jgi:hypothetical protein
LGLAIAITRPGIFDYPGSDSLSGLYCLKSHPIGIKSYPALALLSLDSGYVKSLNNLVPGGNRKNAVRVTLTLSPVTVELLKAQGNMSEAVDKLIQLCILGKVKHDGSLNPVPGSTLNLKSRI